jgi:hypothetical protein
VNVTYIAIGGALIAIGAGALGRAKKAADPVAAKNAKLSGGLMILAGFIFAVTGWAVGRG